MYPLCIRPSCNFHTITLIRSLFIRGGTETGNGLLSYVDTKATHLVMLRDMMALSPATYNLAVETLYLKEF